MMIDCKSDSILCISHLRPEITKWSSLECLPNHTCFTPENEKTFGRRGILNRHDTGDITYYTRWIYTVVSDYKNMRNILTTYI